MDKTTAKLLHDAKSEIESGRFAEAYNALRILLENNVPEALFLYSTFSLAETESEDEFDRRSIDLLRKSAGFGYAPAMFALGSCYETGDLVDADPGYAASLFKSAAENGYAKAKFRHGLNMYFGSNGVSKNIPNGLELITSAAQGGVEAAEEFLINLSM